MRKLNKKLLYIAWAMMYVICAAVGFVAPQTTGETIALFVVSLVFFIPPVLLAVGAYRKHSKRTFSRLALISGLSLGLTTVVYIANIVSAYASETVGNILYWLLILVSVPMVSMGVQLFSMFLWACLLIFSLRNRK